MPRINELIAVSKAGWLGLLAYLAFVGVTLIGVEDADFFIVKRRTELPLIGVTIPTTLFFAIAPGIGIMLYAYLHLYLLKLWEALSEAPAQVNALPIGDAVRPWLIADFALSYRKDAPLRARPLRGMANFVSGIFIFLAAPLVLLGFWWRSIPKHDEVLTVIFCGIPLSVAVYVGVASWLRLRRLARGDGSDLRWRRRGKRLWAGWTLAVALAGWFTTEGTLDDYARRLGIEEEGWWNVTPFPGLLVPAQLAGVAFVDLPTSWRSFDDARKELRLRVCEAEGLAPMSCGTSFSQSENESLLLSGMRLDWCRRTFESAEENLNEVCQDYFNELDALILRDWVSERQLASRLLAKIDLTRADLRRANLRGAQLEGVNLSEARLQGAILEESSLEQANLSLANLNDVKAMSVRMEWANLTQASLTNSDLSMSYMDGINLSGADISGANLAGAKIRNAALLGANFTGAYLNGAQLTNSYAHDMKLDGAYFGGSGIVSSFVGENPYLEMMTYEATGLENLYGLAQISVSGAAVQNIEIPQSSFTSTQIWTMFGDGSVQLPLGVSRPAHWPSTELEWSEFHEEWSKWRADPAGYRPPSPDAVRKID